jgi:hypothetical protein
VANSEAACSHLLWEFCTLLLTMHEADENANPRPLLDNSETAPAYGPCNVREDDSPKRVERQYPNARLPPKPSRPGGACRSSNSDY